LDISKNIFSENILKFSDSLDVFDELDDDTQRITHRTKIYSYDKDAHLPILFRHYKYHHNVKGNFTNYKAIAQDYFTLYAFVDAKIRFVISDTLYTAKSGNFITLNPNDDYTMFIYASGNLDYYEISFPSEYFKLTPKNSPFYKLFSLKEISTADLNTKNTKKLFCILNKIDKAIDAECEYIDFIVYSHLVQAASLICENANSAPSQDTMLVPILKKALGYISENLTSLSNTKQVSDYCNVSVSYLCKLFREHLSSSPLEYINIQKLSKAKFLLKNGYNVTESCYEAGFGSYTHFVTTFKKTVGMTPTEYQNSENHEN